MRYLILIVLVIVVACEQHSQQIKNEQTAYYSDAVIKKLYDFQDRREVDSLRAFFSNPNPAYRNQAVQAMASVQDRTSINALMYVLVNDKDVQVRRSAAYALGQTYDSTAAEVLFQAYDLEDSLLVRKEILEGLGKCVTQRDLPMLNRLQVTTRLEMEGLAWGIYRAALRNVYDEVSEMRAVEFIGSSNSYPTRLAGAHYLGRAKNVSVDKYLNQLISIHAGEVSPFVRMALLLSFKHSKMKEAKEYLKKVIASDTDYRERVSAIRALGNLEGEEG
ncbi:MAG: HEAT repeat domain-containing protein, partial [Cyclobacteriaceae bacterium]|nr:HEAT repeat domain-containing protein [Cyclobacteriaceae bacterium]